MAQTKEQNPSIPWVIRPPHAGHAATEEDEQAADGQSAFLGVSEWCDLLIIGWCGWSLSVGGCHRWDVVLIIAAFGVEAVDHSEARRAEPFGLLLPLAFVCSRTRWYFASLAI